jgi:hypothetical protein
MEGLGSARARMMGHVPTRYPCGAVKMDVVQGMKEISSCWGCTGNGRMSLIEELLFRPSSPRIDPSKITIPICISHPHRKKNTRSISPHYIYFTTMWMGDGGCGTRRFEISITTHIQKRTTISKKNLLWCDKPLHALAPRHRRLTRYLRRTRPTSAPHPTLGALSDKRAKAPPCLINSFERDPAVPSTTVPYRI